MALALLSFVRQWQMEKSKALAPVVPCLTEIQAAYSSG